MSWNFTQAPQFNQQQQHYYQQQHPQYAGPQGSSQHYGNYGNYYQQNVFQMNAWQVYLDLLWFITVYRSLVKGGN